MFCASEYKSCLDSAIFENIEKESMFITFINKIYMLLDNFSGRRYRGNRDLLRIVKDSTCKLDDISWHRSREKE